MSHGDTQSMNPYASFGASVADSPADERVDFIRKTYTHLMMAIFTFAAIEWAILSLPNIDGLMQSLFNSGWGMPAMFGGFLVISWIAESWARGSASVEKQYAGLVTYVIAESIFFAPLLWVANHFSLSLGDGASIGVLPAAAIITLVMFGGLTAIAWFSKADFSFMGAGLKLAGFAAFGLILASMFIGFELGILFSGAMVIFASAYILYDTSNVIHHYRPGQHVAASLALFASVALLLWYVIRILLVFANRR